MAKENEKKPGFFKRLISTKGLARVVLTGVVVAAAGILLSGLTAVAGIPTAVAVGIGVGTGIATVAGAGIGAAGITGLAARGVAHVAKMIFNKNYRNQVKARRQERKQQRKEEKERKKAEKQERKAAKKAEKERKKAEKRAKKKGATPVDDELEVPEDVPGLVEEPPVREDPVPEPVKKPSRKAGGMYDSLSDENKALYDTIMKKRAATIFAGKDLKAVAALERAAKSKVEGYKVRVANGETLTEEEQKDMVETIAIGKKAHTFLRHLVDREASTAYEDKGAVDDMLSEVVHQAEKPSAGRGK